MSVRIEAIKAGRYYSHGRRVRKVLKIETKDGVKKVQYRSRDHKAGDGFTDPYWAKIEQFAQTVDKQVKEHYDKDYDQEKS